MGNLTTDENHTTVQQLVCSTGLYRIHLKIFISALNKTLCVTAFLGNILTIVAIKKVSSLHPPSKFLINCLAAADLCVGAITQSLFVIYLMSPEHSKHCFYIMVLFYSTAIMFGGVSLLTLSAISIDRLLALLMGLGYRQIVTLRRVRIIVITFWIVCTFNAVTFTYNPVMSSRMAYVIAILCIVTSTFCYSKIYYALRHRQTQVHDHFQQGQANEGAISLTIARYRKTVSSALWLQMASLVCHYPWLITSFLSQFYTPGPSLDLSLAVTGTLFFLNSTLDPFLYCWKMGCIRQAVKDTIRQFLCFSS